MPTKKNTSSKLTYIMTGIVLCGFAIILAMNVASMMGVIPSKYISPNDVRGIAVEHDGLLYTLNFEQQNALIDIFNRTLPLSKESFEKRKIDNPLSNIANIIVYPFHEKDYQVTIVGYVSKSTTSQSSNPKDIASQDLKAVFSIPEWNKTSYLEESTANESLKLLQSTYDH